MISTKEQEKKALARIEEIISGLGENSYVGTAFEGCADIARENIESDFGCSMMQERDKSLETAQYLSDMCQTLTSTNENLQKQLIAAEKKTLSSDTKRKITGLLSALRSICREKCDKEEENILTYCEDVEDHRFKQAVSDRKYYDGLISDIDQVSHLIADVGEDT